VPAEACKAGVARRTWFGRGIPGLIGAAALLAALAGTAYAAVDIYSNGFGSRQAFREIKSAGGGKGCEKAWNKKHDQIRIELKRAPGDCTYTPPVQGDGPKPDHRFAAKGKISKGTNKNIREGAYLTVSVRVGGGKRYELRVFPKGQEYVLRRQPNAVGFPATGTNPDIGKIGKRNALVLTANGNELRAKVNGTTLDTITDTNANEITGAKLQFGIGSEADSKRNTIGTFTSLVVSVPNP